MLYEVITKLAADSTGVRLVRVASMEEIASALGKAPFSALVLGLPDDEETATRTLAELAVVPPKVPFILLAPPQTLDSLPGPDLVPALALIAKDDALVGNLS